MSEDTARAEVYARSHGVCETCGRRRATEWAHRLARSAGGRWCPTNGLHQCHGCHDLAGAHSWAADEAGVRLVHRGPAVVPARVPVWRWHHEWGTFGWWLLEVDPAGGPHVAVQAWPEVYGLPDVPGFSSMVAALTPSQ